MSLKLLESFTVVIWTKDIKTLDISNVDLDLINLRDSNDKWFSIIFWLDSRLVWLQKDTWSFWEVESISIRMWNSQIKAYAKMYSNFLNDIYNKFLVVSPDKLSFSVVPEMFVDILKEKEKSMEEFDRGLVNWEEYRFKYDYKQVDDEYLKKYERTSAPAKEEKVEDKK